MAPSLAPPVSCGTAGRATRTNVGRVRPGRGRFPVALTRSEVRFGGLFYASPGDRRSPRTYPGTPNIEMPEPLVIYGNGQMAEVAYARFQRDPCYRMAGFTVDASHLFATTMFGLPVVPFEEIERDFPAATVRLFIAVGPVRNNRVRAERFAQAKKMGYRFVSFVSPHALVDAEVRLGENCSIGENAIVMPFSQIGDDVRIGTASVVGHHCVLEDHCYLAVSCVLAGSVRVGARAFLGAGATVRDGVSIGEACVIGAGATIVRDTAPGSVHVAPDSVHLPISSDRVGL